MCRSRGKASTEDDVHRAQLAWLVFLFLIGVGIPAALALFGAEEATWACSEYWFRRF